MHFGVTQFFIMITILIISVLKTTENSVYADDTIGSLLGILKTNENETQKSM